jgi:hypothetical protein
MPYTTIYQVNEQYSVSSQLSSSKKSPNIEGDKYNYN